MSARKFPIQPRSLAEVDAHPPCAICKNPVVRRPKERPGEWRSRATCGDKACKSEWLSIIETRKPDRIGVTDHPPCTAPGCGGPVMRRPGEKRRKWLDRQFCSPECLARHRAEVMDATNMALRRKWPGYEHPHCKAPGCTNEVIRRKGEPSCQWKRRATCSAECAQRVVSKNGRKRTATPQKPAAAPKSKPSRKPLRWQAGTEPTQRRIETVEEAIARGLTIKRLPPAFAAASSAAVR